MADLKKVLMISYVFPPMAAVGGYRTIKFCKYLPSFGWQPSVLTVTKGFNFAYDYSLLDRLDPALNIYRSANLEPHLWYDRRTGGFPARSGTSTPPSPSGGGPDKRPSLPARWKRGLRQLVSIPDTNNFWIPFGILTGLRAARREKVDIVYSTSPPASAHVVGWAVSRLMSIPLVTDFRDLWTLNENYTARNLIPAAGRFDRLLERRVLSRAHQVITTTDTFTAMMKSRYPDKRADRFHTITNGLDADDFKDIAFPQKKNDYFTILHLGSLYGNRNPEFFFEAMAAWKKMRPGAESETRVCLIGNTPGCETLAERYGLSDMVTFAGHIPHRDVLARLWEADLLLLILGFEKAGTGVIPAKLFEYVATGRPILAFVPDGEARRIIDRYRRGTAVTSPDIETTVEFIDRGYLAWKEAERAPESTFDLPPEFDRKAQAGQLADILNTIVEE